MNKIDRRHLTHRIKGGDQLILEQRGDKFYTTYLSYEIIEYGDTAYKGIPVWGFQSNNSTEHDSYQDALKTFLKRRDASDKGFAP